MGSDDTDVWLQPVLRRFDSPWSLPEVNPPTSLELAGEGSATDERVEFYWVGTEARIAGTLVHRWLQLFSDKRAVADAGALRGYTPVTQRWLRELGVGDDMAAEISARVDAAIQGVLTDSRGRWIIEGRGHAEFALTGLYDNQVESVVIDRVLFDDAGDHWIIDYKTSTHEGGNLAGFLDAECDRYRVQLNKYASIYESYSGVTARCALYFPLLQAFVEV